MLSWNPAAETLFGYTHDEVVGGGIFDLIAIAQEACRVDITFARTDEVNPLDRLL